MPNYIADEYDMINIGGLRLGGQNNTNGDKYDPSVMQISMQDVHSPNSGRAQNGKMKFRLVARKMKIELEWWYPTPDVVSRVLHAIQYIFPSDPNETPYILVSVHNPSNDTWTEHKMYRGDRSMPYQIWSVGNRRFKSLKFSLIEI